MAGKSSKTGLISVPELERLRTTYVNYHTRGVRKESECRIDKKENEGIVVLFKLNPIQGTSNKFYPGSTLT